MWSGPPVTHLLPVCWSPTCTFPAALWDTSSNKEKQTSYLLPFLIKAAYQTFFIWYFCLQKVSFPVKKTSLQDTKILNIPRSILFMQEFVWNAKANVRVLRMGKFNINPSLWVCLTSKINKCWFSPDTERGERCSLYSKPPPIFRVKELLFNICVNEIEKWPENFFLPFIFGA